MTVPHPPVVRGVDHIGITVPDVEQATAFFVHAFGAVPLYDIIAPGSDVEAPAHSGGRDLEATLGVPPGTTIRAIRIVGLGQSASLELFEYVCEKQRPPVRPSDFGIQHFAVYVDDLDAVAGRVAEAGGTLLEGGREMRGPEGGASGTVHAHAVGLDDRVDQLSIPQADRGRRRGPSLASIRGGLIAANRIGRTPRGFLRCPTKALPPSRYWRR